MADLSPAELHVLRLARGRYELDCGAVDLAARELVIGGCRDRGFLTTAGALTRAGEVALQEAGRAACG